MAVGSGFLTGAARAQKPPLLPEKDVAALTNELSGETAKRNLEGIARFHRQRGSRLDLLAGEEERGARAPVAQHLQHRGRPLRVRAVVERQGDRPFVVDPVGHAQRAAQRRHRGSEARREVPHGHTSGEHAYPGAAAMVRDAHER